MQQQSLARIADITGYDRNKVELIKNQIAPGATDDELIVFLLLAQRSGLDPFLRQIYMIERRENVDGQWKTKRMAQTGIDGFRLVADRTGDYAPGREPTFAYDDQGRLIAATSYVLKYARSQWHEVAATAHYDEYVQRKKDGDPNKMWSDKPHVMLAKCAEALALRRAFPANLSGLYTNDEIRDESETQESVALIVGADTTPSRALPAPQDNEINALAARLKALKQIEQECIGEAPKAKKLPADATNRQKIDALHAEIAASHDRLAVFIGVQDAELAGMSDDQLREAAIARAAETVPDDL